MRKGWVSAQVGTVECEQAGGRVLPFFTLAVAVG